MGWRYPASKIFLDDTGNDNGLINVNRNAGVRYNTVDTNSDSCADAIDPNDKDGDEAFLEMILVLKAGTSMSAASLNGDYGFVTLVTEVDTSGNGIRASSTVGQASFDGQGVGTVAANALNEVGFGRYPGSNNGATIPDDGEGNSPDLETGLEYTVGTNGALTLSPFGLEG